ncbi:DUF3566 domain-containing protein [Mycobacterium sp. 1423905.2]|uniref:DUF3566 domain-containing protein n=1 Tax=Mycobacterium sp. 1423905.2 TaxID=1856859 RepID=UPI000801C098|nr:DUF3566 domain-containing protein [Mycobacterium sp. 1423905.2]OBJ55843.1 hypothetical protein A9W95_14565 [Mycobacterium sp. 1423905.2]
MTSPNEPGAPSRGDTPNGDGSAERTGAHRATTGPGRLPDAGDSPPWQRGGSRPSHSGQWPTSDAQWSSSEAGAEPRQATAADARLNRFISGSAAPSAPAKAPEVDPPARSPEPPTRNESRPAEAYASELPDLSGPVPRPTPRKPSVERPAETGTGATASRSTGTETRDSRESRVQVTPRRGRGPVRASMQIRRIDPWSTLKVSLLLSVALFFVWMIAVAFLYLVLGGMGVWAKLNSNVGDLLNNTSGSSGELVSSGTIFGGAVLIGLVNIVLMTAMATIAAFVYNLTTDLIGGIEVTLADRD